MEITIEIPTIFVTTAGKADGLTAGAFAALAERLENDLELPDLALSVSAIHDGLVNDAAKVKDDDYQAAWSSAYFAAFRTFDRPLTLAQAYDVFSTISKRLVAA